MTSARRPSKGTTALPSSSGRGVI